MPLEAIMSFQGYFADVGNGQVEDFKMEIKRRNFRIYLQKKKFLGEISVIPPTFLCVNKSDFWKIEGFCWVFLPFWFITFPCSLLFFFFFLLFFPLLFVRKRKSWRWHKEEELVAWKKTGLESETRKKCWEFEMFSFFLRKSWKKRS